VAFANKNNMIDIVNSLFHLPGTLLLSRYLLTFIRSFQTFH